MALFLLGRIGGDRVALPASAVASVIELDQVTPVPRAPAHIAGLCALRSRVLTVIDAEAAIGRVAHSNGRGLAAVTTVGGDGYAIRLAAVDDVVEAEPRPCPAAIAACWRDVATGMIELADGPVLLIDPAALVDRPTPATKPLD